MREVMIPDLDEWINTLLDCKPYIYKKIAMDFVRIHIRRVGISSKPIRLMMRVHCAEALHRWIAKMNCGPGLRKELRFRNILRAFAG